MLSYFSKEMRGQGWTDYSESCYILTGLVPLPAKLIRCEGDFAVFGKESYQSCPEAASEGGGRDDYEIRYALLLQKCVKGL